MISLPAVRFRVAAIMIAAFSNQKDVQAGLTCPTANAVIVAATGMVTKIAFTLTEGDAPEIAKAVSNILEAKQKLYIEFYR